MGTVLISTRSFSSGSYDAVGELAAAGLDVIRKGSSHELEELATPLSAAIAWISGTGPITEDHLAAAPHLRIIARYGIGTDNVDLDAARRRNVIVTVTPEANSESVADHTLALLLALLRQVAAADRAVRAGTRQEFRSRELNALVVGVVGCGAIGRRVVTRLKAFGADVVVADPGVTTAEVEALGASALALADMAMRCDVVTLHAPGERPLIDDAWLRRARPELLLVNTSRASLVDEVALAAALRAGRVGGYAADVFQGDDTFRPVVLADPTIADRVVLTPHIAAHTREAIDNMSSAATAEVLAVLAGRPVHHPVATRGFVT